MGGVGKALGSVTGAIGGIMGGGLGGLTDALSPSNGFQASGVTQPQVTTAYDQTQEALKQQQAFLNALQAQGGIANQTAAMNQLQGIASGTGPNLALNQLNQATGANVANQAALMAGQRGAASNPGMIARQAAQQGGQLQQQAAGQAAINQAAQQQNAINAMGNLATTQVGQQAATQQNYGQNALQQQQNLLGALGSQNQANAATAAANQKTKADMTGGLLQGGGQAAMMAASDENLKENVKPAGDKIKSMLDNAGAHEYNYKDPKGPGAGKGKHVSPMAQELEKSELGKQMVVDSPDGKMVDYGKGFGTMMAAMSELHKRLEAVESPKKMADGGEVAEEPPIRIEVPEYIRAQNDVTSTGPKSAAGKAFSMPGGGAEASGAFKSGEGVGQALGAGLGAMFKSSPKSSPQPAGMQMSGGSVGAIGNTMMAASGAVVPGQASVKGDSLKNDKVKALLSPGEIVIPRSVAQSANAPEDAARFVASILSRKKHSPKRKAKK